MIYALPHGTFGRGFQGYPNDASPLPVLLPCDVSMLLPDYISRIEAVALDAALIFCATLPNTLALNYYQNVSDILLLTQPHGFGSIGYLSVLYIRICCIDVVVYLA